MKIERKVTKFVTGIDDNWFSVIYFMSITVLILSSAVEHTHNQSENQDITVNLYSAFSHKTNTFMSCNTVADRVSLWIFYANTVPTALVQSEMKCLTFKGPRNRFQGISSASLYVLARPYDSVPSPHRLFENSSTG